MTVYLIINFLLKENYKAPKDTVAIRDFNVL